MKKHCIFVRQGSNIATLKKTNNMKTENRFVVREVVKFDLLFGYVIFDRKEKEDLPYYFGENEKNRAESKAALNNILYK